MAAIVEIATEPGSRTYIEARHGSAGARPSVGGLGGPFEAPHEVAERLTVADDPEAIFERFAREDWTDGLPIVPPTEERVARMLAGSDFDPSCSLGPMPPSWRSTR